MKSKKLILFCWGIGLLLFPLKAEVLSFSKAYELALEHAHHVKASAYATQSERERINEESAQLYPHINFSGFYKKSEYERNPTKEMTQQGLINYSVNAQQTIYNPSILSRINLQEARSKRSEIELQLQKEELAQELFSAYLELLKSQNRINLLQAYLQYNQTKLVEIEKRYEMELANKMDLLQMRVETDTAKIELQKEERLFKVNKLKFQNFIGDIAIELPKLTTRNQVSQAVKFMEENVSKDSDLEKSLYIRQALASMDESRYELEYAQDGHMPQINLEAAYSFFETDDPLVDSQYNSIKYVMVSINLPLYSGGATSSRVESSRLMELAAREEMYNVQKETQVMFDEYIARFQSSAESVWIYNTAYNSAELYVEAIEKGYAHGLKSLTDLNDAKNKLYEVKFNYIENIYELVHSYIGICIVKDDFSGLALLDKLIEE
jgi:outer membrane protein